MQGPSRWTDTAAATCSRTKFGARLTRGPISAKALGINARTYYAHDKQTEADGYFIELHSWRGEPTRPASWTQNC